MAKNKIFILNHYCIDNPNNFSMLLSLNVVSNKRAPFPNAYFISSEIEE